VRLGRRGCATIPDARLSDAALSLTDALMAAVAMVALTLPSLLAVDQARPAGHLATLDGMQPVPCDTHRHARRAPLCLEARRPVCQRVLWPLQCGQALAPMALREDSSLVVLDSTGYGASTTLHWASCLPLVHRNGLHTSAHQMLGPRFSIPDVRDVMPRLPEPSMK
jgi:hypothetical protein